MSENAVAVIESGLPEITEKMVTEYLDSLGNTNDLLPSEKKMFINIAREFKLNPFKREIHITAYGQGDYRKCSIITGYEVYLKRAERTGKLDGWKMWTEGEGSALKAVVEIYRKDQKHPFQHEVYYNECCQYNKNGQPNAVWAKQPKFMTKKVAIGQAFRLCFPDDLGGMPYEESEMPQHENGNHNVTPENLANEAMEEPQPLPYDKNVPPLYPMPETEHEIIMAIRAIMNANDPDGRPYFTVNEREMEWAIKQGAENVDVLKNQYERLKKELDKRAADYKPIPFGDKPPAMYAEPEQEFVDDIPEGIYPADTGGVDIF